jgi:RNA polymerase sigma-70 factor (ECF subfamily)
VTGSRADAEEVVGDLFVALLERRPELDAEPRPYLRRAVVNRALNVLRRRRLAPRAVPGAVLDARPAPGGGVEILRDGIARLPARQAEVFVLRHLEGLTAPEIGAALGIAPSTVRVHLHHAVRALRVLFDPTEARHG